MSPRPYRLGQRQAAAEQTRARILAAARALLTADHGFAGFTIDALARQASVARMTVYYQFGSKRGLLEALFDDLAVRGLVDRLRGAMGRPDPRETLDALVAAFGGFWASDRVVIRRLRALAALDPEVEQSLRARDARRRHHLRVTLERLSQQSDRPAHAPADELIDVLQTLTSFETFDTLAGPARTPTDVIPLVQRLVRRAVNAEAPGH